MAHFLAPPLCVNTRRAQLSGWYVKGCGFWLECSKKVCTGGKHTGRQIDGDQQRLGATAEALRSSRPCSVYLTSLTVVT